MPAGAPIPLPDLAYEGTILLGRTDLASGVVVDIDLARWQGREKKVSRKHARLTYAAGKVTVADWESQFGVFHNKEKLEKGTTAELKAGDELRLAELVLRVDIA